MQHGWHWVNGHVYLVNDFSSSPALELLYTFTAVPGYWLVPGLVRVDMAAAPGRLSWWWWWRAREARGTSGRHAAPRRRPRWGRSAGRGSRRRSFPLSRRSLPGPREAAWSSCSVGLTPAAGPTAHFPRLSGRSGAVSRVQLRGPTHTRSCRESTRETQVPGDTFKPHLHLSFYWLSLCVRKGVYVIWRVWTLPE